MSTTEPKEVRLKRLKIRSWRRGTREMDLVLGRFFDDEGQALSDADLDLYEVLLNENDHDIYAWLSGRTAPPETYLSLLERIEQSRSTV